MATQIGGLIPLLLQKSILFSSLRTLAKISLFYGGLVLPRYFTISVGEVVLLSLVLGGISAFALSPGRASEEQAAIWTIGKRSFFFPAAILVLLGWLLLRWANLPNFLFKAGLATFIFSTLLCLQYLERDLTPETALSFLQMALFIPIPVFLSIICNGLNLL